MIPWCSFILWYNQLLWCIYFWSSLYFSSHHNAGTLSVWLTTQDCWSWLSLMILCRLLQIPHFLWLFSIPSSFQKHLLPTCSTSEAMFWGFKCKTFYKMIWFLSHRVQSNEAKIHKQGDEWSSIMSFNFFKTLSIIKEINIMFQSSWYIYWGGRDDSQSNTYYGCTWYILIVSILFFLFLIFHADQDLFFNHLLCYNTKF